MKEEILIQLSSSFIRFFLPLVSGSSTKGYQQLSAEDEDNNNEDQQQCNRKKKKKDEDPSMTRTTSSRFGSIDEDDMSSSSDSGKLHPIGVLIIRFEYAECKDRSFNSDEDEDERLERLTCWVCERAFSSTKILDRHKIRERHFG